jgi:hypothetical protein
MLQPKVSCVSGANAALQREMILNSLLLETEEKLRNLKRNEMPFCFPIELKGKGQRFYLGIREIAFGRELAFLEQRAIKLQKLCVHAQRILQMRFEKEYVGIKH